MKKNLDQIILLLSIFTTQYAKTDCCSTSGTVDTLLGTYYGLQWYHFLWVNSIAVFFEFILNSIIVLKSCK